MSFFAECWSAVEFIASALVLPVAVWIIISGLDDLFIDIVALLAHIRSRRGAIIHRRAVFRHPQARIAMFVPCWREDAVIANMIETSLGAIYYRNYDVFVGVYPNDEPTQAVARELEARHPNVHSAMCPRPGPTSKADCLNAIYERMCSYESERSVHFDVIVTHDAEDVVDPEALHWINHLICEYDMVQIPVLPVQPELGQITRGVYCDEFSEYQSRDMPARQFMGAFVPSSGVGTGFRRSSLEALAAIENGMVFDPACLTEDYENGLRLRQRGARQCFVPFATGRMATRELFPNSFFAAVRQRTRWVTGIAFQTWDRHGWRGSLIHKYWFWRDRKGVIGNPVSLTANVLFVIGLASGPVRETALEWPNLFWATFAIAIHRLACRIFWSGRNFGCRIAILAPVRALVANLINSVSDVRALGLFLNWKLHRKPLAWVKTEHEYPELPLPASRLRIGDILVRNGYLTREDLESALRSKVEHVRIGEHLVGLGMLDRESLQEALAMQSNVSQEAVIAADVRTAVARALPASVCRTWTVLPIRIENGTLHLARPEPPTPEVEEALITFTNLRVRFHLVTQDNYAHLISRLL